MSSELEDTAWTRITEIAEQLVKDKIDQKGGDPDDFDERMIKSTALLWLHNRSKDWAKLTN